MRLATPPDIECKAAGLDLSSLTREGRFSGYASLFGIADLGADVVERGAFSKSLASRGAAGIRLLWQHDPAQVIGRFLTITEDRLGLGVEGELTLDVSRGREAFALLKAGAIDGLSIGFRTIRARTDRLTGHRHILEADLWEISIVTFPMQPGARIGQVKADPALEHTIRKATRRLRGTA